jgi:hypothetical protein
MNTMKSLTFFMLSHSQEFDLSNLFPDEKNGEDGALLGEYVHVDGTTDDLPTSPNVSQEPLEGESSSSWSRFVIIVLLISVFQLASMWYTAHQCAVTPVLPSPPSHSYLDSMWNQLSDVSHKLAPYTKHFPSQPMTDIFGYYAPDISISSWWKSWYRWPLWYPKSEPKNPGFLQTNLIKVKQAASVAFEYLGL